MNDGDQPTKQELREAWIESLLQTTVNPRDVSDRVAEAMERINEESEAGHPVASGERRATRFQWWALALAASVLFAAFFVVDSGGTSGKAMAAVERSLNVAAELLTRQYSLQVHYRDAVDHEGQMDFDLFVRGQECFALRHSGLLPATSFWFGKNASEEWVVPPVGPVRKGTDMVLSRWLRAQGELDTPYLHVTSLLTRMSSGYRLRSLPDEEVTSPNGVTEWCQHTRADLEAPDESNLPDTIELWSSRDTAMAVRIVARWNVAEGESGTESVALAFESEKPLLAEDWFTAESHYEGRRIIMRVDSLGQPTLQP